jgi:hypothetical protein
MRHTLATRAIVAVTAAVFTLTLSSCDSDPEEYPPEVRANFMASCESQAGATSSMCDRCFEAIKSTYSYDEFVKIDTAIQMGTASREDSDRLAEVLKGCA